MRPRHFLYPTIDYLYRMVRVTVGRAETASDDWTWFANRNETAEPQKEWHRDVRYRSEVLNVLQSSLGVRTAQGC